MILPLAVCVVSLLLLAYASDQLVDGAVTLSRALRISPLAVGVVLMGFGTSMPELLVSGLAAARGSPDLGIGNILGSNIANLSLVLGVAAIVVPVGVSSGALRREAPLAAAACGLFAALLWDGLSTADAVVLAAALVAALSFLLVFHRRDGADERCGELDSEPSPPAGESPLRAGARAAVGLAGTLLGAHLLVWGGLETARLFGLAEGFVGLSLVAVGTSLPELAAAVQASRRGEGSLVVGNLLGSNLFNSLAVGGAVAWLGSSPPDSAAFCRAASAVMLVVVALSFVLMATDRRVERWEAALLLLAYLVSLPILVA